MLYLPGLVQIPRSLNPASLHRWLVFQSRSWSTWHFIPPTTPQLHTTLYSRHLFCNYSQIKSTKMADSGLERQSRVSGRQSYRFHASISPVITAVSRVLINFKGMPALFVCFSCRGVRWLMSGIGTAILAVATFLKSHSCACPPEESAGSSCQAMWNGVYRDTKHACDFLSRINK